MNTLQVRLCMEMSLHVYNDTIESSKRCVYITGTYDGQAIIRETDCGRLVIAFRGTDSYTDWIVNILSYRRRFTFIRGAYVHAGYLSQHDSMWDQIIEHLSWYTNVYKEILVTGHSLGGAQATLFSARVACLYPELSISCYTFGAPRVGNIKFVEGIHELTNLSMLRVNNENDIATWVPCFGFIHTPEVVHIPVHDLYWYECRKRHSIRRMYEVYISKL